MDCGDRERYKDDGRRYPSDLTDAEWELVRSLFETYPTLTRIVRWSTAVFISGPRAAAGGRCPRTSARGETVRGYWDRFRRDGRLGGRRRPPDPGFAGAACKAPAPSTGTAFGASPRDRQKGERGVDGNKKVRGIKRHLLTCSFGFVLAVLVSAARPAPHARPGTLARPGGRGRVGPAAGQGRRHLRRADGPRSGRAARHRRPGLRSRPQRPRVRALADPVADRGHVRHAHQPLPAPDQGPLSRAAKQQRTWSSWPISGVSCVSYAASIKSSNEQASIRVGSRWH